MKNFPKKIIVDDIRKALEYVIIPEKNDEYMTAKEADVEALADNLTEILDKMGLTEEVEKALAMLRSAENVVPRDEKMIFESKKAISDIYATLSFALLLIDVANSREMGIN